MIGELCFIFIHHFALPNRSCIGDVRLLLNNFGTNNLVSGDREESKATT
jgi:hypothetical protein